MGSRADKLTVPSDRIENIVGDAKKMVPKLNSQYDMVFIDAEKREYLAYLEACERLIHKGSLVVADNVRIFADQLGDYLERVGDPERYKSTSREGELFADTSVRDAIEVSIRK